MLYFISSKFYTLIIIKCVVDVVVKKPPQNNHLTFNYNNFFLSKIVIINETIVCKNHF